MSQDTLLYISSSSSDSCDGADAESDAEVSAELTQLLPRSAQAVLAHMAAGHSNTLAHLQAATAGGNNTTTTATATPSSTGSTPAAAADTLTANSSSGQQQQQQRGGDGEGSGSGSGGGQAGQLASSSSSSNRPSRRVSVSADVPGVHLWDVPDSRFKGDLLALLRCVCVCMCMYLEGGGGGQRDGFACSRLVRVAPGSRTGQATVCAGEQESGVREGSVCLQQA